MTAFGGLELAAPSINAAVLRVVTPTGVVTKSKASGALVDIDDQLYLLTNWHVVTGQRWMTPAQWVGWQETHPGKIPWLPEIDQVRPEALDVQVPLSGKLYTLARLLLDDPVEEGDGYRHRYAWDDPSVSDPIGLTPPAHDLVCLHLGSAANHWSNIISSIANQHVTLGYQLDELGLDHGPQVGDRVYIVGYPLQIGLEPTDPPVWISGSIATPPDREWNGPRFLIDARTRHGQSGSAVIAYAAAQGGLPPRHHLLGIYSGRIDEQADIGSVWWIDDLINDVFRGSRRPRPRELADSLDDDSYILKDIQF